MIPNHYGRTEAGKPEDKTLELMWSNLPDYTDGRNALVMADTSGSMMHPGPNSPISVSVSLALYFAERNKGAFENHFLTFSAQPELQSIVGSSLRDKMHNLKNADWDQNTNLQAAFDLVLNTAVANSTPDSELPRTIYIISDMEFDSATSYGYGQHSDTTNFEEIARKYEAAGYEMPQLVFWNVDARNTHSSVTKNQQGVTLVSGFSTTIFRQVMEAKTPRQLVDEVLASDRLKLVNGLTV